MREGSRGTRLGVGRKRENALLVFPAVEKKLVSNDMLSKFDKGFKQKLSISDLKIVLTNIQQFFLNNNQNHFL